MMHEKDIQRIKQFINDSSDTGEKINNIIFNILKFISSKIFLILGCLLFGFIGFFIGFSRRKD
jgi:hypothetical protein